jgi:hypothetical protein
MYTHALGLCVSRRSLDMRLSRLDADAQRLYGVRFGSGGKPP